MSILTTPGINFQLPSGFNLNLPPLQLDAGEWVCLTGANGSGKSLLLDLLAGIRPGGPEEYSPPESLALIRGNPENQFFFRRVEQELVFPLENRALPVEEIRRRLEQVTQELNLKQLLDADPWSLSGGQKQLVVLAVALMQDPAVWLLDDALAYLDRETAGTVIDLLQRERRQGKLLLTITQDSRELAHADRVIHLCEGGLEFSGSPVEFRNYLHEKHPDWVSLSDQSGISLVNDIPIQDTAVNLTPFLQTHSLSYSWTAAEPLLEELELDFPRNRLIHLQGEMGSGKTTLALLLAGLLEPNSGEIELSGKSLSFRAGSSFAQEGISYTFQYPEHQFFLPTFRRELEFQKRIDQLPAICRLLNLFALPETLLDEPLPELPRGYRRLLALLEPLTGDQPLLLLDEPFIGLDIPTRQVLLNLLREMRSPERTIVLIDHLVQPEELQADFHLSLRKGD